MTETNRTKRTILKKIIKSQELKEERNLRVYLPPGYMEWGSYPVIYCQDGEQFFNFGRIATHMHQLILEEYAEPVIIVGVDVELKHRTEEYTPDGSRFDSYCRFFADELLPFIEQEFGLQATKEERILAGDSLGGTVSLHLALIYPDLFDQVISLSGAFMSPTQEAVQNESDLSNLKLYMLIGTLEEEVKTDRGTFDFLELNRQTYKLLQEKQACVQYVEKEGKHIWGFWQDELPDALRYFLA